MPTNINTAFSTFLTDIVNLAAEKSQSARSSRNWLIGRLHEFDEKYDDFPRLYNEKDIAFGSFERKTKKRPLDDIDMMMCMSADGASYTESTSKIEISVPDECKKLRKLCFEDSNILSSRKVINKFIEKLNNIPQYDSADINRNQEACTLKLKSYEWNFDVVPCFFTAEDYLGKTYYIIPDGNGNWKKTDPRVDKERVTRINQQHDGNVLNIIRIVKFWNRRATMPSIPSYLLENIILNYYESKYTAASSYVYLEFPDLFYHLHSQIFQLVIDPKGIQGDLNNLTSEERDKVSSRCYSDYQKAVEATHLESRDEIKSCFRKWTDVFGSNFPQYG